jgi:alpha-1,6-mannosyltransferase
MHICDVNNFYSPRGGGVKTYHQQKLRYFLERTDHEYTLLYAAGEGHREDLSPRVRVIALPGVRMNENYHFALDAIRLRREVERLSPDLIEVGEPYLQPWVVRVASIGRRRPIVGYWHADFPRAYVQRPISRIAGRWAGRVCGEVAWWYARRTYGPFDAVFASSGTMAETLRARGFPRVFETPLGVDTRLFHPARRDAALRASIGAGEKTVVFISPHRLSDERGRKVFLVFWASW